MTTALAAAEPRMQPRVVPLRPLRPRTEEERLRQDDLQLVGQALDLWAPHLTDAARARLVESLDHVILAARANAVHNAADALEALRWLPGWPIKFRLAKRSGLVGAIAHFVRWSNTQFIVG